MPALLISPWTRTGEVDPTTYDHTTIIRTALDVFDVADDPALGNRVAHASNVLHRLVGNSRPPAPLIEAHRDLSPAIAHRQLAEDNLQSVDELGGFEQCLVKLKAELDQDHSIDHPRAEYIEPVSAAATLQGLVTQFRRDYVTAPPEATSPNASNKARSEPTCGGASHAAMRSSP